MDNIKKKKKILHLYVHLQTNKFYIPEK